MAVRLTRVVSACAHCGRDDLGSSGAGWGAIDGSLLCRPTVSGRPHCYGLVTLYRHPLDCRCQDRYPVAGDRAMTVWA